MRGVGLSALAIGLGAALLLAGCGSSSKGASASGSGSSDAKPYVDAVERGAQVGDNAVSAQEAKCIAPKLVAAIGLDRIKSAGVTAQQLASSSTLADLHITPGPDTEQKVGNAFGTCVTSATVANGFAKDIGLAQIPSACAQVLSAKAFGPVFGAAYVEGKAGATTKAKEVFVNAPGACAERLMLAGAAKSAGLTQAQQDCIAAHLDDGVAAKIWHGTMTQGSSFSDPQLTAAFQTAVAACR